MRFRARGERLGLRALRKTSLASLSRLFAGLHAMHSRRNASHSGKCLIPRLGTSCWAQSQDRLMHDQIAHPAAGFRGGLPPCDDELLELLENELEPEPESEPLLLDEELIDELLQELWMLGPSVACAGRKQDA